MVEYINEVSDEISKNRKAEYPIYPILLNRWSPRAMNGDEISDEELFCLFEAARWAPSSYNGQPWRFIYAKRNTDEFKTFMSFQIEFNQKWTANAAVLLVIISHNVFEKNQKPSITHSFDAGAAWENLAIEGSARGYVVHGMQGFDYERVRKELDIPDEYTVEAMAAIGVRTTKDVLDPEIAEKEKPSTRKPIKELIMKGKFIK